MKTLQRLITTMLMASIISGCQIIPSKKIYTEINITAKPEKVWAVLTDIDSYPKWNPYHVEVKGVLKLGEKLQVKINKPNGAKVEIEPHVMRIEEYKELTWGGGIEGIFFGEHTFLLEPGGNSSTRLIQKETFDGMAIPFASLEAIEEGYQLMNESLKSYIEKAS